jgi:hypothetical protein
MTYEQRNNSGTLGRNKNKTEDRHPDHKGSAIIDGVEYWVSAWVKQNGTTGEKFFSLSYQKKEEAPKQQPQRATQIDLIDDDIPF